MVRSSSNVIPSGMPKYTNQLLFVGRGLDFQSTADQLFSRCFEGMKAMVTDVIAVQVSGAASIACMGGVYSTVGKGGNAVVPSTQSWVTLADGVPVYAALAAIALTSFTGDTLYLTLTTGSTGAIIADVFVFGVILD